MEVDCEAVSETIERVGMVFTGEVAGIIDRDSIRDGFEINTDSLCISRKERIG